MKKITILFIIAMTLIVISCKKETQTSKSAKQILDFHWHSKVGTTDAAYGVQYTTADGVKFKLSDWRYYVSNFVLIREDGTEFPIADKVFLINLSNTNYSLDSVPVGNYKGLKFLVGLDTATNHKDPTLYTANNPLALQSPSIHWSWNSGYIFMKIEGKFDSTSAQLGGTSINQPFFFHVGMDNMKQVIDFSEDAFSIVSGEDKELNLSMDFLKILNSVQLKTENATHTGDNLPLATKISNNWKTAFTLE